MSDENMSEITKMVDAMPEDAYCPPSRPAVSGGAEFAKSLSAAMRHVGSLDKDKENKHGGYGYVSEAAVKRAANKALHANGLAIMSCRVLIDRTFNVKAKNGGETMHIICEAIICVGDGLGNSATFRAFGQGSGYDDKVLMKAQSTAIRETWKTALCIAQGHDPEDDEQTDRDAGPPEVRTKGREMAKGRTLAIAPKSKSAKASTEQMDKVKALLVSLNIQGSARTEYCVKHVGVSGSEMTVELASRVIAIMEAELAEGEEVPS